MAEKEIGNLAELAAFVAEHKVVVADFYATWCGPCVRIGPHVHKKSHETGIALAKINVDVAEDVSATHGIQAMPTFKVFTWENGKVETSLTKTGGSPEVVNAMFTHAVGKK